MKKSIFLLLLFCFCGCAIFDLPVRFLGFSTQKFENEKEGIVEQTVQMSKKEAFNKTLQIIFKLYATVTHKSFQKGYIVAFNFSKFFDYCLDSTEAAFYFEEIDENTVRIKVISNNTTLAKLLGKKYFEMLYEKDDESK